MIEHIDTLESGDGNRVAAFGTELRSGPLLLRRAVRRQKESLAIWIRGDDDCRARFAPAGQIEKVVVLPEPMQRIRPLGLRARKKHEHAFAEFFREPLAARTIVGVRLPLECEKWKRGEHEQETDEAAHARMVTAAVTISPMTQQIRAPYVIGDGNRVSQRARSRSPDANRCRCCRTVVAVAVLGRE